MLVTGRRLTVAAVDGINTVSDVEIVRGVKAVWRTGEHNRGDVECWAASIDLTRRDCCRSGGDKACEDGEVTHGDRVGEESRFCSSTLNFVWLDRRDVRYLDNLVRSGDETSAS